MHSVYFAFGIHNHQPVGNFDFVFEEAFQKAYLPFLELLAQYPFMKIGMHYSGILLEWIDQHHPEYIQKLKKLVHKGQIEMLTGGYYEPILISISEEDRLGQIQKLNHFIEKHIGDRPLGMWCAERVWEPHLPKTMVGAGIQYSILDDAHFKYAGFEEHELHGYFVTEELGDRVYVFPINEKLRYAIPFRDPENTIAYLRSVSDQGGGLVVFADDGEKFGIWPETYTHVYERKWLERFFGALQENQDWIHMIHFREAIQTLPPLGRVYLPTASYREMMHWALRLPGYKKYEEFETILKNQNLYEKYHVFVRGGFWRNFLAKYPEANWMHKRMLSISKKVWRAQKRIPRATFQKALDHVWAGQCNCPYWHGVFGGLYLPHLRHANFSHLIQAEALVERATHSNKSWIDSFCEDIDGDGHREYGLSNRALTLIFSPVGGRVVEWDEKTFFVNFSNIMNRREEGYHHLLLQASHALEKDSQAVASIHDLVRAKEPGLEKKVVNDPYFRGGFSDHFFPFETTLEDVAYCRNTALADFVHKMYDVKEYKEKNTRGLCFQCYGEVQVENCVFPVQISKKFSLNSSSQFLVHYTVECKEAIPQPLLFGIELAFAFTSPKDPLSYYLVNHKRIEPSHLGTMGEWKEVSLFSLTDERLGCTVITELDSPATVWRFPLETVSMSESGFERVYQGSVLLLLWKIRLDPNRPFQVSLVETVQSVSK